MAWVMAMVLAIIVINPERLVILNPPTVNNRVDYVYLSRLPEDGYSGWLMAYEWAQDTLSTVPTDGFVQKDLRRDIFYSMIVVGRLTTNYHNLLMQYGTEAEVHEYLRQVVEATSSTTDLSLMQDIQKTRLENILDTAKNNLGQEDWLQTVSVNPSYTHRTYHTFSSLIEQRADMSFYSINVGIPSGKLDATDSLFSWSGSGAKTFASMRRDIGTQGILDLQKKVYEQILQISKQPKNEQDFEFDISLNSPFMR
jgi:hypothetical protein